MITQISEEQLLKRIREDNPWWATGKVEEEFTVLPKRLYFNLFFPLLEDIQLRRAVVLMGPRRVGKTVMLRHAIQELIEKGVNHRKICYISIDAPIFDKIPLERLFELCRMAIGDLESRDFYVLFDEIQYLKNWEVHLKSLVDTYRQTKFLASGSAAAALRLKSNESGAGRFTDFTLPPLTFHEYLDLQGIKQLVFPIQSKWGSIDIQPFATADILQLNQHFIDYLNLGGYPEVAFNETIRKNPGRFIKNDIVDKVLLRDLPSLYGISDVQELNSLFNTVAFNTAKEFTLETLNKSSHVQKATIRRYLEYLEAAYLIRMIDRVDKNAKRFSRANFFKIYLTNPSIRRALFSEVSAIDSEIGDLVETAVVAQWMHREEPIYYARWSNGEVDIVGLNSRMQPGFAVEVKWSDRYVEKTGELSSLLTFMTENKLDKALVTTISKTETKLVKDKELYFMPAALYAYTVGHNTLNEVKRRVEGWLF